MTIKLKIRLSNILMLSLPIAIAILIVVIGMSTSFGNYWYSLQTMYKDENGIQSAQSLIYTYQQELWENNWGNNAERGAGGKIQTNEKMQHLEKKLEKLGYRIIVKKDGKHLYSNLTDEDMDAAVKVAKESLVTAKMMTLSADDVYVIKNTFYYEGKEFSIIAINSGRHEQQAGSYFQDYILRYFHIFIVVFLIATVITNAVLSYWLSWSVLKPLEKLSCGTKEIKEGNLDAVLDYDKQDEIGVLCQDFEEMRKYLKQSVEQRLEDEKRRQEMIYGISHDLRTPLTSIGGYLDGLMDGIADTPDRRERYLNAMKTRTKDLERLVDSLSEYSSLANGEQKYNLVWNDFRQYVSDYLRLFREEAKNNRVIFLLESSEEECYLYFDTREMDRVFSNLITNTVRYREREASVVKILLSKEVDRNWVEVIYADDGPGVKQENLSQIFDTFFRADMARSHAGKGSGIGLAIVKKIIEGHGGTVSAENRNGLAIIIKLPSGKEKRGNE